MTAPAPAQPVNPCYRTRNEIAHKPHVWRNGIEVQYDVRCPGYPHPRAHSLRDCWCGEHHAREDFL